MTRVWKSQQVGKGKHVSGNVRYLLTQEIFGSLGNRKLALDLIQGGAPTVISWFTIPITIDITTINPSYSTYKPT